MVFLTMGRNVPCPRKSLTDCIRSAVVKSARQPGLATAPEQSPSHQWPPGENGGSRAGGRMKPDVSLGSSSWLPRGRIGIGMDDARKLSLGHSGLIGSIPGKSCWSALGIHCRRTPLYSITVSVSVMWTV
jgi:hypothetical protein